MASKSSAYCFLCLTLFLVLTSSAAASAERLQPEVAAGCWKEIYQIPKCLYSIIHAFFGNDGGSIDTIGAPCCAAFLSLTGDCQVEIFQNSTIIPLIETFCAAIVGSEGGDVPLPPPESGGDLPPFAPAPENGGDFPWPEPEPPVWAPAPEDDSGSAFPWPNVRLV